MKRATITALFLFVFYNHTSWAQFDSTTEIPSQVVPKDSKPNFDTPATDEPANGEFADESEYDPYPSEGPQFDTPFEDTEYSSSFDVENTTPGPMFDEYNDGGSFFEE